MSKIVVEVYVPASGARGDVFIPYESRFREVTDLVKAVFADDAVSNFAPVDDTFLCDAESGSILNMNLTAQELGLVNGSRLILV